MLGKLLFLALCALSVLHPAQAQLTARDVVAFPLSEVPATFAYHDALVYESEVVEPPAPAPLPALLPPTRSESVVYAAASPGAEQWRELVASHFPAASVDAALRVLGCESRGNPESHNINPATSDDSVGLFQINLYGKLLPGRIAMLQQLGYDVSDRDSAVAVLKQPEANIRAAAYISGGTSFTPWSCAR